MLFTFIFIDLLIVDLLLYNQEYRQHKTIIQKWQDKNIHFNMDDMANIYSSIILRYDVCMYIVPMFEAVPPSLQIKILNILPLNYLHCSP